MTPPTYLNRPPPEYVIGVDESGTGALAGPFTVCAFMSRTDNSDEIRKVGARDSKQLTHKKRLALLDELGPLAVLGKTVVVPNTYVDQKKAWREAIASAVKHCLSVLNYETLNVVVKIDGASDFVLEGYFDRTWELRPEFHVKGDQTVPQISAASIFAKCYRTQLMSDAHRLFPVYGWCNESGKGNDGYGTAEHLAAIQKHGICELHRRVRPLLPYFDGEAGHRPAGQASVHGGSGAVRSSL